MAEVAGLVIAITTVAGTAAKVSTKLIRLANDLSSASEDIEEFADDMKLFSMAITISLNCLRRYTEEPALATSPVLKNLVETKGMEQLLHASARSQRRITKTWDIAKSVRKNRRLFEDLRTSVKWLYKKQDILVLRSLLGEFKSDILLIVNSLALELKLNILQSGDIPESVHQAMLLEIEDLKAQIKVQVKTLALAQEREERQRQRQSMSSTGAGDPYQHRDTLQDILVDLGTSMVEHGLVPSSDGHSPSSSTTTDMFSRPSEVTTNASTPISTPLSESPQSSSRGGNRNSSYRYIGTELPVDDLSQQHPRHGKQVENKDSSARDQHQGPSSHVPLLRHKPLSVARNTPATPQLTEANVARPEQIVPGSSTPAERLGVTGYINTSDGLEHVKAEATTKFPQGAISERFAKSLGLVIQPYGDGSEDGSKLLESFYSNGEEVKSTGYVILEWRGASTTPPFNIKCGVFPDQPKDLVFGDEFIKRREFYADGGEDENGGKWMK
ncbi:hypothetical protein BKA65DRAFT_113633 [Rhexocercosporidium sp. MPI-PUGE-AT-0058]|nr:hypothetical protein BKA65DRAFT_113633 [Rhexocercosporidium sp. MPI-PUGE-AT-0058]